MSKYAYAAAAILAISLTTMSAGCSTKPSAGGKVLARVSDSVITEKEFDEKLAKMPPYYRKIVEKDRVRLLEEMIMEKLFYEDAVRKGLGGDKEIAELLKEAKRKIVIAKLVKVEVDDKVAVGEDEMKAYYEAHKADFKTPEMWRASHILVATEKDARDVLASLAKGDKFEEIAAKASMDATASRGGDIGFFRLGQLVPDFEKACLALKVGQTSDVVRTQFGYHIIRLTDKKEPGIEEFAKAKARIESELKKKKRIDLFEKLVNDLKNRYGVKISEDAFPGPEARGPEGGTEKRR
jgi:peptidyl-prolyl cis-trans isomerase C